MSKKWEEDLEYLIPEEVDLIFTGKVKVLCSRQSIVNLHNKHLSRAIAKQRIQLLARVREEVIGKQTRMPIKVDTNEKCHCSYTKEGKRYGHCFRCFKMELK